MWQQKLSNTTTSVIAQYPSVLAETVQPAGVFMKKPSKRKRRGKRYGLRRRAQRKATQGLSFSATQDSRALQSLAPFLPPLAFLPSFLRSRFVCRLRPPPKLRPFPHFPLASTALSGVENNGFRLCCFAAVFVRSWEFNPCSIS
jgi:hypothetical protein